MFCLSNISTYKTFVAHAALHQKPDNPQQTNAPQPQPSLNTTKSIKTPSFSKNKFSQRPPNPIVIQIERAVGAGSFRDTEPRHALLFHSLDVVDKKKSVVDWFLGQAVEGAVEKNLRVTGEWLSNNSEKKIRSSGKGILMFMVQWMLPIWAISLLVACGAIKLPFSSPFLDDLIM
ncbi:hypothetical protein Lalb_Chr10g0095991 [Lupinus albus]|uniref:Chlororespiratory reduction 3 n=1 Tax=Lupinus albus TaxID=3870 RepID=A0A6A4PVM3_LUPAL|nr:hypothetical protein Lalb_Chr10g0095991 [Lupinus albus]